MNDPNTALQIVDLTKVYWIVGALVVANMSTIGTILFWAAKGLWWISKLDARVSTNTKDVNQAHSSIRRLREEISDA